MTYSTSTSYQVHTSWYMYCHLPGNTTVLCYHNMPKTHFHWMLLYKWSLQRTSTGKSWYFYNQYHGLENYTKTSCYIIAIIDKCNAYYTFGSFEQIVKCSLWYSCTSKFIQILVLVNIWSYKYYKFARLNMLFLFLNVYVTVVY